MKNRYIVKASYTGYLCSHYAPLLLKRSIAYINFVQTLKNTSYELERLLFIHLLLVGDMFGTVLSLICSSCLLKPTGPDSFWDIIGNSSCHMDWNGMYKLFLELQSNMYMIYII